MLGYAQSPNIYQPCIVLKLVHRGCKGPIDDAFAHGRVVPVTLSLLSVRYLELFLFFDTRKVESRETSWPLSVSAASLLLAAEDRSEAAACICHASRLLRVFCLVHRLGHR